MNRNGSSNLQKSHEFFRELCTLVPSGELDHEERGLLAAHLRECKQCRSLVGAYTSTIAAWASSTASSTGSEHVEEPEHSKSIALRLSGVKADLFRQLEFTGRQMTTRAGAWHLPVGYATAAVLLLGASLLGYWLGAERSHSGATPISTTAGTEPAERVAIVEKQLQDARSQIEGYEKANQSLQADLQERSSDIRFLRGVSAERNELKKMLAGVQHQLMSATSERDSLNARTHELEAVTQSIQSLLSQAQTKASEEADRADRLQADLVQATVRAKEAESQLSSQQQYLASDRDIRELMGARDLYMADVVDVDRNGKTRQAHGRIFYTKGKSLAFYAFDLDKQPHPKNATFQVWGLTGPKTQTVPINMGVFYLDSENHKRWIMKFEDPKELARIDSVFVTVEPAGGSTRPSGPQLMFASLQNQPNHP